MAKQRKRHKWCPTCPTADRRIVTNIRMDACVRCASWVYARTRAQIDDPGNWKRYVTKVNTQNARIAHRGGVVGSAAAYKGPKGNKYLQALERAT